MYTGRPNLTAPHLNFETGVGGWGPGSDQTRLLVVRENGAIILYIGIIVVLYLPT